MNSPRLLRLVMAPLVCCLTLTAFDAASAAPVRKPAAPAAAAVVEPPAPKRSFLKKLNPFQKKPAPPVAVVPAVAAKNSQKSTAATKLVPPAAPIPVAEVRPPVRSIANAKTLPPMAPAAPAAEPKKTGFFSRLKAKLDQDPEAVVLAEKPARPADWKEHWVVTDDSTAFYEFGPSQSNGPDLRLPFGQVVKLSQSSRGWAKVELEGGRQGYIGTDQMRQATETDFSSPILPAATQLAAVGTGASLQGWSPIAPAPDLPDLPMAAGMENSLLLLPPLEYEGTELKKSSLKLRPLDDTGPILQPGDALPPETFLAAPEPPTLDLEVEKAPVAPVLPPPTGPVPAAPAPITPPPATDSAPAEPAAPSPAVPS